MADQTRYRVIGTITKVKGECSWGHKVGDRFDLSSYSNDGLCGIFYHDIFPYIIMLRFGGSFPWGDGDRAEFECNDKINAVTIELKRER